MITILQESGKWWVIFIYYQHSNKYSQIFIEFLDNRSIKMHTVFIQSVVLQLGGFSSSLQSYVKHYKSNI